MTEAAKREKIQCFSNYIYETFSKRLDEVELYIYGMELQTCGAISKCLDSKTAALHLMNYDIREAGSVHLGLRCALPEEYAPFPENAVVLISQTYEYISKGIAQRLHEQFGIPLERIVHARGISQKLLAISADYYGAKKMDLKVKQLFETIGRDLSKLSYLDIGANEWLIYNNTYLFYRAGARGVLVEPNPDLAEGIRQNRPQDKLLTCGCTGSDDSILTYYKTNRAGHNTFVKEIADTYAAKGVEVVEELEIPIRNINDILKENFPSGHIDYMSVDIEGMGASVVNAIDSNQFSVDLILLEMEPSEVATRQLYLKLRKLGYEAQYKGIGGLSDFMFYKASVFSEALR